MKYIFLLYLLIGFMPLVQSQKYQADTLFKNKEFDKIIKLYSQKDKKGTLSLIENYWLARAYGRNQKYSNGLFYAKKLERKSIQLKDTVSLLLAYNLISENLIDLNKVDEGIAFCERVAPFIEKHDSVDYQNLCFKWGMMYKINGEYKKALAVYDKITLPNYRKLNLFINNYATILESLNKYNEALTYYKKGLKIGKENGKNIVLEYANTGKALFHLNRKAEAKMYFDSAESSITKHTTLRDQRGVYKTLYQYYLNTGDPFMAGVSLEYVEGINEEIFYKRLNEKIHILENSHQKEKKLNKQLIKSQKTQFKIIIGALLTIFCLLFFLFRYKYKNVKSAHEKIVIEQKLLRSQMTPHFIFNSLSILQGMILNKEIKKSTIYLSKFSKLLRLVLENSREKLVPISDELDAIKNYVDLQNMRNVKDITLEIINTPFFVENIVYIPPMIIQPFVENAILHGFKRKKENCIINIKLRFENKKLFCTIQDNGIGIETVEKQSTTKKESLSTKITLERLAILSKELKVEAGLNIIDRKTNKQNGTIVSLILPYKIAKND